MLSDISELGLYLFCGVMVVLIMCALTGRKSIRFGGGGKGFVGGAKRNLGMMGLLVILFGSLAFGNCLALQGA